MDKTSLAQQPYLTFFQDDTAEYDVIVDQSSSAPNLKEATWGAIQPLLPIIGESLGPDEMALILEYSPMPESFLEKFKAIQEQRAQQQPPPDPETMKVEAMIRGKEAELKLKEQEAVIDAQIEQRRVDAQIALEEKKNDSEIRLAEIKAAAEIRLQQQRAKSDMAIKATSARADMAGKAMKTRADIQMKSAQAATESEDDDENEAPEAEDMDVFGNKALADSLTQMAQAITQMAQANQESQRMMAQGIAALGSELKEAMTKPKTILRGPDGRAIGVQ